MLRKCPAEHFRPRRCRRKVDRPECGPCPYAEMSSLCRCVHRSGNRNRHFIFHGRVHKIRTDPGMLIASDVPGSPSFLSHWYERRLRLNMLSRKSVSCEGGRPCGNWQFLIRFLWTDISPIIEAISLGPTSRTMNGTTLLTKMHPAEASW